MSHNNTIFNQVLQFIPRHKLEASVRTYETDKYVKYYTTYRHMLTVLYSQAKGKDSLRDIRTSLFAQQPGWYHVGIKDIRRSTVADANERIDPIVFEELFYDTLKRCKDVTPKHKFAFKNPLYSIDATVIDLCLEMYPWAKFRKKKGGIKLHYQYDHSGSLPVFMVMTDAKHHEMKVMKNEDFPIIADSITSVDMAYIDYKWLFSLYNKGAFFVTRKKSNMNYKVTGQLEITPGTGIISDRKIKLTGFYQQKDYPKEMRLIKYRDPETNKVFHFITNNFKLATSTIAKIYKSRWQIELFFKWIKQNLKIKSFLGTSKNAVLNQIWIAMIYYLVLTYIKYQTKYKNSMLDLSRMISEMLFNRLSLIDLLSLNWHNLNKVHLLDEAQLCLF